MYKSEVNVMLSLCLAKCHCMKTCPVIYAYIKILYINCNLKKELEFFSTSCLLVMKILNINIFSPTSKRLDIRIC